MKKKKNQTDLTLRNLRAMKARIERLEVTCEVFKYWLAHLVKNVNSELMTAAIEKAVEEKASKPHRGRGAK